MTNSPQSTKHEQAAENLVDHNHIRPMTYLITAALMALTSPAAAFDLSPDAIGISGLSYHGTRDGYTTPEGDRKDWNEINIDGLLSFDIDPVHSITTSAFKNSYDDFGAAVVIDQIWARGDIWDVGLFSGVACYPTYGVYQLTSYANLGDEFADFFLVGGIRARVQKLEIRYTSAEGDSSSLASVAYVIDLHTQRNRNSLFGAISQRWSQ